MLEIGDAYKLGVTTDYILLLLSKFIIVALLGSILHNLKLVKITPYQ